MITANIASHLPFMAEKQPQAYAVVVQSKSKIIKTPYGTAYTYKELDEVSDLVANGLKAYGIKKGTRTVLMVKPGLDFFALAFALLKLEAIMVMVDPGMGIKITENISHLDFVKDTQVINEIIRAFRNLPQWEPASFREKKLKFLILYS